MLPAFCREHFFYLQKNPFVTVFTGENITAVDEAVREICFGLGDAFWVSTADVVVNFSGEQRFYFRLSGHCV